MVGVVAVGGSRVVHGHRDGTQSHAAPEPHPTISHALLMESALADWLAGTSSVSPYPAVGSSRYTQGVATPLTSATPTATPLSVTARSSVGFQYDVGPKTDSPPGGVHMEAPNTAVPGFNSSNP